MAFGYPNMFPVIGVEVVDQLHSRLGALLSEAKELARRGDPAGMLAAAVEFKKIAITHFLSEEVIIRSTGIKDAEKHLAVHKNYINMINDKILNYENDVNNKNPFHLIDFIDDIVFEHEIAEDVNFFNNVREAFLSPLVWNDRLEVGFSVIDDQHRNLLSVLNDIRLCEFNDDALAPSLDAFFELSQRHFSQEEELLGQLGLSLAAHRQEHLKLVRDLEIRISDFQNTRPVKMIGDFLCYWLIDHIVTHDIPDFRSVSGTRAVE